jgi:heme/copper-type cytochrome/quinol oxidase subunit 4
MERKLGIYNLVASIATSIVIVLLFYFLAAGKLSTDTQIYKAVDMYAGIVYVFILSMIVSASIWPEIIEKKLKGWI